MTTKDFKDRRASLTLLIYFSAIYGLLVLDRAKLLRSGQYTIHLAGLVYYV